MGISEFFDKIYCINLDRRPDRWEENCLPQFEKLGMSVERISATDGASEIDLPHDKTYKSELAGCYSHLNAIKKAKEEGVKHLLLLEDDVVFIDDVNEKFSDYMTRVPTDWEILFFGGNHIGGTQPISDNVVKLRKSYAVHACGINESVYDIMITHLEKNIDKVEKNRETRFTPSVAVDYFLADLHKVLNVYCFKPHIAWQLDGFSDIQNANVDYKFLK
jgi:GR25 family glycosyltransferase involved in LPS biosynthesis